MTRTLATLVTIVALTVLLSVTQVFADDEIEMGGQGQNLSGTISRTTPGRGSQHSGGGTDSREGGGAYTPGPRITRDKRGITYDYSHLGGGELHYIYDENRDWCHGSAMVTRCYGPEPEPADGRPRRRAPVPPPISPTEVVERTIVNVRLPQPKPNVDPGYAVTGLKAYLETGNSTTHTFDPINTVLGPLSITATSTYSVSWGDGSVTGPYSNNGGKYPHGRVTHVYQDARTVDIVVTQNWTASWSLAGQSGTIGGLSSSGSLPDFEVREVQAVRRR